MSALPEGWAEIELRELVELKYGKALPKKTRIAGPINVYGSNGIVGTHTEALTRGHTIVVGRKGSFGEVHVAPEPCFPIDTTYFVDEFGELDPDFIAYLLKQLPLKEMNRATAIPGLNRGDAYRLSVSLPPAAEQKRIVAKIDSLTGKSARARTELTKIEALVERYKAAVLDAELLKAEQLNAPTRSIAEVAETTFDGPFGSNLKSADYTIAGKRVIRLENIGHLEFIGSKATFIKEEKFLGLERHHLRADDVLFSSFIANNIRVCKLPVHLDGGALNKADCFAIRVNQKVAEPSYVMLALAGTKAYDALSGSIHGATRPRINLKQLRAYSFALPPLAQQRSAVSRIQAAHHHLGNVVGEMLSASAAVDRLDAQVLAKAFLGELVPQDPNDEPAKKLLERSKTNRTSKRANFEAPPRIDDGSVTRKQARRKPMAQTLLEALEALDDWVDAQDLFEACGVASGSSTDDVERLYDELRALDGAGRIEVEPVLGAGGQKLTDRLRLKPEVAA
tara:strand:- start:4571 stop:6097 length:1527 start_codon:yes stop_codon:yes gene_type:complete